MSPTQKSQGPPILAISDGNGGLRPDASVTLVATILYPTREDMRLSSIATVEAAVAALQPRSRMPVKARAEAAKRLMEWHTETRAVTRDAPRYGIQIAGELLLTVMALAERNPYRASLNAAIDIWARMHVRETDRHGFRIPTSPRSITGDKRKGGGWSTYRTVAPLAAAVSVWAAEPEPLSWIDYELETRKFLALASKLREFGVSHRAPQGRSGKTVERSLLDPSKVWDLPADLSLPPAPPIGPIKARLADLLNSIKI